MPKEPEEKFKVYLGDQLPNYVRPLAIVSVATINVALTVLERYILVPESRDVKRKTLRDKRGYRIDLTKVPDTLISLDTILRDGVEASEAEIDREFFTGVDWQTRFMLIGPSRYTFREVEPNYLFRYKWNFGFGDDLRRIKKVTRCIALQENLEIVGRFEMPPPKEEDPFDDTPKS